MEEGVKEQIRTILDRTSIYTGPLWSAGDLDFAEVAEKCKTYREQLLSLATKGIENPYGDIRSSASLFSFAYGWAIKQDTPGNRLELLNRLAGVQGKLYRFLNPQISYLGRNLTEWNDLKLSKSSK